MRLALAFLSLFVALTAGAQEKTAKKKAGGYPPTIEGTKSETYRKVGDTELKVWIFDSRQKMTERPLPAIVFFFGGGWTGGSPTQFEPQSRHLAARGMVAIVADYRVKTRQDAKPADCVSDAKACVRWVRANASRLGIEPERIAVGGGSAGGHLAASTATVPLATTTPAPRVAHACFWSGGGGAGALDGDGASLDGGGCSLSLAHFERPLP